MKRSALKKRANISNNPEIIKLFKKQRNYFVNLRKVKTIFPKAYATRCIFQKFLEIL